MGPIAFPDTSVTNSQSTLRKIPEERSHLYCGEACNHTISFSVLGPINKDSSNRITVLHIRSHFLQIFFNLSDRRGSVVNITPRPPYSRTRKPLPISQEARWVPGPVWTGKSRPRGDLNLHHVAGLYIDCNFPANRIF